MSKVNMSPQTITQRLEHLSQIRKLVITSKSTVPRFKRGREIRLDLQRIADIDIDILVYTQQEIEEWKDVEFSFLNSILKTGKVIYQS